MIPVEHIAELLLILLRLFRQLFFFKLNGEVIVFNMAKLWANMVQLNHDVVVAVQRFQPWMIQQLGHSLLETQTITLLPLQQLHTNTRTPIMKAAAWPFSEDSSGKFYRVTGFFMMYFSS